MLLEEVDERLPRQQVHAKTARHHRNKLSVRVQESLLRVQKSLLRLQNALLR